LEEAGLSLSGKLSVTNGFNGDMLASVADGMDPRGFPVRADVPGFKSFDSGRRDFGACSRLDAGVGIALFVMMDFAAEGGCKLL
jgi:hypothetical protein